MQRATAGFFHEPQQLPQPPASSITSNLTSATPAKRITFYKSGDARFKGVKMAIHKRSFKCFDALLDDLSQKVPLPFGVRTITTPRGTHSIKHLEQLEDGGCYLCSDRRHVKPINIEAMGKRPTVWHHHNVRRKPSRPEDAPYGHQNHHRHPKRIILVKNNDPAVRRSILLSRRTARSLRVFIEEVSELMQCHVKKLYTLEGRKVSGDFISYQSLMQCPSVLVCVGREPFRPLLMENSKKLPNEMLPGMGTRSRSSVCSEGHESKKNVNFGLETKKSIIHPRSDSSTRSTRFSLSSEKSYQNELCTTPGQSACVSTCPYIKEVAVSDDIQKRVLVNKDGSLSVEMNVRFRLFSNETLQWSTEIKKLNDGGSVKERNQHYHQAKAEYSEPDSICQSETEETFATKMHEKHLEESLCQNCCNHCQEYDIWKNPMHKSPGGCKSPSSSGSSQKVSFKKTSVNSMHTITHSSEEYTEHVVEKTVEEGDTRVEYCARSRCCNRSEISASRSSREDDCESNTKSKCFCPTTHYKITEDRAIFTVNNSPKVHESLKDNLDDDYDDLPPSISQASNRSQSDHVEGDTGSKCIHCRACRTSPRSNLSPRPPSKASKCASHSLRSKKYTTSLMAPVEPGGVVNHRVDSSAILNVSSRSCVCHCETKTLSSFASGRQRQAEDRCEDDNTQENEPLSAMSVTADLQKKSGEASVCLWCKGLGNPKDSESQMAKKITNAQNCETIHNYESDEETTRQRSETTLSKRSNCIDHEKCPVGKSEVETAEEITKSGMLEKSLASATKSEPSCMCSYREPTLVSSLSERAEVDVKPREESVSPMCTNLDISASSHHMTYHKSKAAYSEQVRTPSSSTSNDLEELPSKLLHSQGDKSQTAAAQISTMLDNHCGLNTGLTEEVGAMSNKSNPSSQHLHHTSQETKSSVKTCCKLIKTKATVKASGKHSHMQNKDNRNDVSATKSNERVPSVKSCRSHESSRNHPENTVTSAHDKKEEIVSKRANSQKAMSQTSVISGKPNACSERSIKLSTPHAPASQEMSQEMRDGKDVTQNALTVTSPLPRSSPSPSRTKSSNTKVKQTKSGMSVNSKISQRSSNCHCHTSSSSQKEDVKDESEERDVKRLSGKSQLDNHKKLHLDEPLSPTSTASVGLPEEHKCDDLEEQSTSDMSITTEIAGCKLVVVNGVDIEEMPMSPTISEKSHRKTPLQTLSPVSAARVRSANPKTRHGTQLNGNNIRASSLSPLSVSSSHSRGSKKNTVMKGRERITSQVEMTDKDNASNKIPSQHHKNETMPASGCLTSSQASEHSEMSKNNQTTKETEKISKCSSHCNKDSHKTSQPDKTLVKEDASRPNSVEMSDVFQKCRGLTQEIQNKHKSSDSSDSVSSQAVSAADLLREIVATANPTSRGSKSVASSKSVKKMTEKCSRKKHREDSNTSEHNNEEQFTIMPSCLPNASPTEVVNEWLRNNPIDGPAYEIDVEMTKNITETQCEEEVSRDKSKEPESVTEVEEPREEEIKDQAGQLENSVEAQLCNKRPHVELNQLDSSPQTLTKKECVEKQCQSVQVMKVLLNPKLNRCSSLPEVSPVHGRRLTQSAQGLLDCLANLQLIDSDSKNDKHSKYNEVMTILQSLWLQEPSEDKQTEKDQSAEDELNLQSSSGVDVSSGSTGSVKGIVEKSEMAQCKILPLFEALKQDKDESLMEDEKTSTAAPCEGIDASKGLSDPTTPDIAERVQGSAVNKDIDDTQENTAAKDDDQTQQESSNKSSGKESDVMKSSENASSGTPSSVQRAPLTKRISQDPNPVWMLNLLKKLEKQFMLHYADAMAEFRVKWDLDDTEMLNTMIGELKAEVHKRIQSSINRELQKLQGRAGRGPRPPGQVLSRESTVQTQQRRKRLRVMRNKSITLSEDNYTASGTEYSDQRSDDEYCPCDACMKKKMASKAVQRSEALSLAPVMMEFDLRKILQMKKDPARPTEQKVKDQTTANRICTGDKEDNDSEVLREEVEEVSISHSNKVQDLEREDNMEAIDKDNQDVCADHKTKDEVDGCSGEAYDEEEDGKDTDGEPGNKDIDEEAKLDG
nr:retinitis pigmentosa 1-like 1 protein [Misgurnus anguillicaudatus]